MIAKRNPPDWPVCILLRFHVELRLEGSCWLAGTLAGFESAVEGGDKDHGLLTASPAFAALPYALQAV